MRKYRTFTPEFKAQVVLEIVSGRKSQAQVCREHQLKESLVSRWRTEFVQNASKVFQRESGLNQQDVRIAELEQLIGRLTLQLEIAKKASTLLGLRPPRGDERVERPRRRASGGGV